MSFAVPVLTETPGVSGQATCERTDPAGLCRIAWDFSGSPRTFYWVQQFDTETESWKRIGEPAIEPYGASGETVPGGFLYRVLAGNDQNATEECASSSVCWAPVRPKGVDEIPERIPNGRGQQMIVSKNFGLDDQASQYNVYLLVQLLNRIDLSRMPPMTKPRALSSDPSTLDLTDDELINEGVYVNYEAQRAQAATR